MNPMASVSPVQSQTEIGRIQNGTPKPGVGNAAGGTDFKGLLNNKIAPALTPAAVAANPAASASEKLKFSAHAIERMRSRGISMNPETLEKLNGAVDKAEKKGAKETLVLTQDAALIVNIKNRTVITAMDKGALKDNVFTNIDSTVVI